MKFPHLAALIAITACAGEPGVAPVVPPYETFTIHSQAMGETRTVNVYVASTDTASLPVVYMPDGGIAEDFPHVAGTIDSLVALGEMVPVILVGVENTERRRDMTDPTAVSSDSSVAPRVGGSAAFHRFWLEELKPDIGRRYGSGGTTAIIGESLAGYFIVESFLRYPGGFDQYIAISPSLWWNARTLIDQSGELTRGRGDVPAGLLLTAANETDIVPHVTALADTLAAVGDPGISWRHQPRPDLKHGTIYRAVSPGILRDLFPAAAN